MPTIQTQILQQIQLIISAASITKQHRTLPDLPVFAICLDNVVFHQFVVTVLLWVFSGQFFERETGDAFVHEVDILYITYNSMHSKTNSR